MLFFVCKTLLYRLFAYTDFFIANAGVINVNALRIDIQTVDDRRRIIELTNDSVSDSESNEIPTGGKMRKSRCVAHIRLYNSSS